MGTESLIPDIPVEVPSKSGSLSWGYLGSSGGMSAAEKKLEQEATNPYTGWLPFDATFFDPGAGNTINLIQSYLLSPIEFRLVAPTDFRVRINTLRLFIQDDELVNTGYGGTTELTNGVEVFVENADDELIVDYSKTVPIVSLNGWQNLGSGIITVGAHQKDDDVFFFKGPFLETNAPTSIQLEGNGEFVVKLNDDFSRLIVQTFSLNGTFSFDTTKASFADWPYVTGVAGS